MEEDFQYTNKFLRDNKDFILSLFFRGISEDEVADWNNEQNEAACFSRYVESVLDIVFHIVCTLNDNRLKRTATVMSFLELKKLPSYMLVLDFLHNKELSDFICKFITVDVLKRYLNLTVNSHPEYQQSNNTLLSYAQQLDNRLTNDISPYKFLKFLVFCYWYMFQTNDNEYSVLDENIRYSYYHSKFKSYSWFACLEYAVKSDCTEEQFYQTLGNIIEDYTKIDNSEAKETLRNCLLAFSVILKYFVEQDSKWIETDDRENFCGILIPQEQTKEERRIEVAADYLVEHHYISDNVKDLFVNIMNNRCPSGKIKFSHGVVNGKSKKKGGMNVLYGIIRFIREENFNPDVKEGKRQNIPDHSNDCCHFDFPEDSDNKTKEEKWNSIKDSGRRNSRSLSYLIKELNSKLEQQGRM